MRGVMRITILSLALCLGSTSAIAAEPARRGPTNPDEPWVFRTVLDDRPRIAIAALGDALWAAWDTQACRLYQVWKPGALGVKLTGAVFDGKHGPQPTTDGTPLLREPSGPGWFAGEAPATVRYRGHRLSGPRQVSFLYEVVLPGAVVRVEESPSLKDHAVLVRSFHITGLPSGARLALRLSGDANPWAATGGGCELENDGEGARLVFSADGDATLTGT